MGIARDLLAVVAESEVLWKYSVAGAGLTWWQAPEYSGVASAAVAIAPVVHDLVVRLHRRLEARGQ